MIKLGTMGYIPNLSGKLNFGLHLSKVSFCRSKATHKWSQPLDSI